MATRRGQRPTGRGPGSAPAGVAAPPKGAAPVGRRVDARQHALRQGETLHEKLAGAEAVKAVGSSGQVRVTIPDLTGIRVTVQAPPPPTEADIDARLDELVDAYKPMQTRELGEAITMGDEILVDAVGYAHGVLFSSQMDAWLRMAPSALLPGLFEGLEGTAVGTHTVVPLSLPADYPDESLRGASAAFAVDVKAANAVAGDVDRAALFRERGYGATDDEVRAAVRKELEEVLATELVNTARGLVLDELQVRAPGEVPDELITAELQKGFRVDQGEHLARASVAIEDQNAAFEAYVSDEERRRDVRRRLWEAKFLDALAEKLQVETDKGELLKLMSKLAGAAGLTATSVHSAVRRDEDAEKELIQNLRRARALEIVLEKADVRFLPAEASPA